jgi:hypothetical protein
MKATQQNGFFTVILATDIAVEARGRRIAGADIKSEYPEVQHLAEDMAYAVAGLGARAHLSDMALSMSCQADLVTVDDPDAPIALFLFHEADPGKFALRQLHHSVRRIDVSDASVAHIHFRLKVELQEHADRIARPSDHAAADYLADNVEPLLSRVFNEHGLRASLFSPDWRTDWQSPETGDDFA